MKKIVIVAGYSLGESVIQNRLLPIVTLLISKGHKVVLISPDSEKLKLNSDLVEYKNVAGSFLKQKGFLLRAFSELLLARNLMAKAYLEKCDLLLVSIPSMFCFFLSQQKTGVAVLDVRDLTWEYLDGNLIQVIAKRLLRAIARLKIRNFNYVSYTNKSEESYLINSLNVQPNKLIFVPNGVSASTFNMLGTLGPSNQVDGIRISYIGNVGIAQNLDCLLKVAKAMPDIKFNIVGTGIEIQKIRAICSTEQLYNVKIFGKVTLAEVIDVYRNSDILYAQLSANYSTAVPSKLYEYLATGKYVIYGGLGVAKDILSDFENNSIINPDDPMALSAVLKSLKHDYRYLNFSHYNQKIINSKFIREENLKDFERKLLSKL